MPELGCALHNPEEHLTMDPATGVISNDFTKTTPFIFHFNGDSKRKYWSTDLKARLGSRPIAEDSVFHAMADMSAFGTNVTLASLCRVGKVLPQQPYHFLVIGIGQHGHMNPTWEYVVPLL